MVLGIVNVMPYPRAAATKASAIPVLPLVGSTISLPADNKPFSSASQTMLAPIRHLMLELGFLDSILA